MIPKFHGEIGPDGKVHLDGVYQNRYADYLAGFKTGDKVCVTLAKSGEKQARSDLQNNYYWAVVVEITRQYCGYEKDEMHDAFGMMFRKMEPVRGFPTIQSTKTMTTVEFEDYVETCRRFAATELGLYIPKPNEVEGI